MKLISMRVENIKGCELAEAELGDRAVTIVGGDNHQGKSSFLDSLAMALGGKRLFPPDPIKEGEEEAQIVVKLRPESDRDALLPWPCSVTRTLSRSADGTSYTTKLEIESDDHVAAPSPQTLLNELINGGFAFDPLAFVREKPAVQAEMLRDLVGVDFSNLDEKREQLYSKRTDVNRVVRDLKGKIRQAPALESLPKERLNVSELTAALAELYAHNDQVSHKKQELVIARNNLAKVTEKQQQAEQQLKELEQIIKTNANYAREYAAEIKLLAEKLETLQWKNPAPILEKMEAAEETNRAFDRRDEVLQLIENRQSQEAKEKDLTKQIRQLDRKKSQMIAEAKWPIEGLGFGKDGIVLNGVPFVQLASSEQFKCAVAIALHKNPQFRVAIIRDGSLLDKQSMLELTEIVASQQGQCLIERVGRQHCHIVFENGRGTQVQDDE